MADNPHKQDGMDPQENSDMGQMGGGTTSQSGQKGGQAQTDMNQEYGSTDTKDMEDTTTLGDEDL